MPVTTISTSGPKALDPELVQRAVESYQRAVAQAQELKQRQEEAETRKKHEEILIQMQQLRDRTQRLGYVDELRKLNLPYKDIGDILNIRELSGITETQIGERKFDREENQIWNTVKDNASNPQIKADLQSLIFNLQTMKAPQAAPVLAMQQAFSIANDPQMRSSPALIAEAQNQGKMAVNNWNLLSDSMAGLVLGLGGNVQTDEGRKSAGFMFTELKKKVSQLLAEETGNPRAVATNEQVLKYALQYDYLKNAAPLSYELLDYVNKQSKPVGRIGKQKKSKKSLFAPPEQSEEELQGLISE